MAVIVCPANPINKLMDAEIIYHKLIVEQTECYVATALQVMFSLLMQIVILAQQCLQTATPILAHTHQPE